jgi:PleD family two-component response regulator
MAIIYTRFILRGMGAPARSPIDEKRTVRILIADDHEIVRNMVRSILEQQPNFQVCSDVAY